jgi:post-segregation antitoxin (ccd killing protein)
LKQLCADWVKFPDFQTLKRDLRLAVVIMNAYNDNMVRTQISVDESLYQRAKKAARRRGISIAELCRQGLEKTLANEMPNKPWMELAGVFEGKPDDSVSIDSELYGQDHP